VCVHVCWYACECVCMCDCTRVCERMSVRVRVCKRACVRVCTCTCVCKWVMSETHTHTLAKSHTQDSLLQHGTLDTDRLHTRTHTLLPPLHAFWKPFLLITPKLWTRTFHSFVGPFTMFHSTYTQVSLHIYRSLLTYFVTYFAVHFADVGGELWTSGCYYERLTMVILGELPSILGFYSTVQILVNQYHQGQSFILSQSLQPTNLMPEV